jgi:hypothetical protein
MSPDASDPRVIVTPPRTFVELVMVLLVRLWASESPTMVPEGAVTTERTPDASLAMPEPEPRFSVLPPVPENRATSLSTALEAVLSSLSAFRFAKLVLMSDREFAMTSDELMVTIVDMAVSPFWAG